MRKLALVALAAAAVLPLVASARHVDVRDPNDTEGRFDVKLVEVRGREPLKWRIKTWNRWTVKGAWDAGYMLVYLDTFGNDRADYYALARSTGEKMVASLWRDREKKRDYRVRLLKVSRPSRRMIEIAIPLGTMKRRSSRIYGWSVRTLWSSDDCKRVCFDSAPNRGDVEEPGAPDPTIPPPPTPTPTPTPTP